MTPDEDIALLALQKLIEAKTEAAKENTVKTLAKHLTIGYYFGAERGIKETRAKIRPANVGIKGLDRIIDDLGPRLDDTFGNLSKDLTDVISTGIKDSLSYEEIRDNLRTKMKTWGDAIPFENAGKTIEIIKVMPDGTMQRVKHTIARNVTLSIDTYAATLSRTATKRAYAAGHIEAYKAAGLEKWQYSSVADERTRERHIALHGQVFVIGSPESDMAFQVMSEHNCRCRPSPYFDDPNLDTPAEEWAKEKEEWAKSAMKEAGKGETAKREFLDEVINDRRLNTIKEHLPLTRAEIRETKARLNAISKSNAKLRDDARKGMKTRYAHTYEKYNGVPPPPLTADSEDIRKYFLDGMNGGKRYLSDDEIRHMGQFAIKKNIAAKIAKEGKISEKLNRLTYALDSDIEDLIKYNRLKRGGYTPFVKKLDSRIIGRGSEEFYIHSRTGQILRYESRLDADGAALPKTFMTKDGVLTFNAIDERTFIPLDYVMDAANSGIGEIRMVVQSLHRGSAFPSYKVPSRIYRIRTNGLDAEDIRTAYRDAEEALIASGRVNNVERAAWDRAARKLGFEYDEIDIDVTQDELDHMRAGFLEARKKRIAERYTASIAEKINGVKPLAPSPKPTTAEIIAKREDEIRSNKYETLVAVDNKGNIILDKNGGKSSVALTNEEAEMIRGSTLTHNHPRSTSFSEADIRLASMLGVPEIRIASTSRTYTMKPGQNMWNAATWRDTIKPSFDKYNRIVREQFMHKIDAGTLTIVDAEDSHFHTVWARVAKRVGLIYKRVEL